jgi:hypothetical protein
VNASDPTRVRSQLRALFGRALRASRADAQLVRALQAQDARLAAVEAGVARLRGELALVHDRLEAQQEFGAELTAALEELRRTLGEHRHP